MLCPKCGVEVGSALQLCPKCEELHREEEQRKAEQFLQAQLELQKPKTKSVVSQSLRSAYANFFSLRSQLLLAVMLYLLSILFVLIRHPDHEPLASSLLAAIISSFIISVVAWGWFWTVLITSHPILGLMSFFIPFLPYYVVLTHPEGTLKPLLTQVLAAFVGAYLFLHFERIAGQPLLPLFDYVFWDGPLPPKY